MIISLIALLSASLLSQWFVRDGPCVPDCIPAQAQLQRLLHAVQLVAAQGKRRAGTTLLLTGMAQRETVRGEMSRRENSEIRRAVA